MKLTSEQKARRDEIVNKLQAAWTTLDERIDDLNGAVSTAWDRVRVALDEYELVRVEAEELRDEIADEAENAISEKSEKWQEGEKGQAASAWVDEWSGLDLSEIDLDEPDAIETPDVSHADDLANLSEES